MKARGAQRPAAFRLSPSFIHGEEILETGVIHDKQRRGDEHDQEKGFYQGGPGGAAGWHVES